MARVRAATTGGLVSHRARLFTPCQDPHGASSLIRDLSGESNVAPIRQQVHVDAAYYIPMTFKPTLGIATAPHPSFDFVFPAAYWTLAARSPLGTSEALNAGLGCFVRKGGNVLPVVPHGHSLVVMAPFVLLAHAIRVANEQVAYRY